MSFHDVALVVLVLVVAVAGVAVVFLVYRRHLAHRDAGFDVTLRVAWWRRRDDVDVPGLPSAPSSGDTDLPDSPDNLT